MQSSLHEFWTRYFHFLAPFFPFIKFLINPPLFSNAMREDKKMFESSPSHVQGEHVRVKLAHGSRDWHW